MRQGCRVRAVRGAFCVLGRAGRNRVGRPWVAAQIRGSALEAYTQWVGESPPGVLVEQQERPTRIRGQERFRRAQRLRSSMDFQRVRRQGRTISGSLLALGYSPKPIVSPGSPGNESRVSRVGFSINKRVGPAVVRNVIKRRLRESIRRQWSRLAPGWDIVITARTGAAGATYQELNVELRRLLERAHLLAREPAHDVHDTRVARESDA